MPVGEGVGDGVGGSADGARVSPRLAGCAVENSVGAGVGMGGLVSPGAWLAKVRERSVYCHKFVCYPTKLQIDPTKFSSINLYVHFSCTSCLPYYTIPVVVSE